MEINWWDCADRGSFAPFSKIDVTTQLRTLKLKILIAKENNTKPFLKVKHVEIESRNKGE